MPEQGKINGRQATMLLITMILPTAILTVPALTAKYAGQDGWASIVASTLAGLLLAWLVVNLSLRFPGKTLFQYLEEVLGRIPGKVAGLLYIWWFLHMNSLVLDEFGAFMCTAILPETPPIILHIVAVIVSGYAVYLGLEVLSRFNLLIVPLFLVLLLVVFLMAIKEMRWEWLLPVFEKSPWDILQGSAPPTSWMGEIVTFSIIIPCLNKPREAYRVAVQAILFIGAYLLICILVSIFVFGPFETGHWLFPTFEVVRIVSVANFLERLDPVVVVGWMFGGFIKIGVFYYAAVLGSAQWLGLKDYRPLVAPLGTVLIGLAMLCPNVVLLFDFLSRGWPPYALTIFEAGIPLTLLLVSLARGKRGKTVV